MANRPTRRWRRTALAGGVAIVGLAAYLAIRTRPGVCEAPHLTGDARRPSWGKLLAELPAAARLLIKQLRPRPLYEEAIGRGRGVLIIPAFLANDVPTSLLRRTLEACGFRAFGWSNGLNLGARADLLDRLGARLDEVLHETTAPVALIGWSLGGLYARELAKRRAEDVSIVITLGTPFSVDLRDNDAWKLYEAINDHTVDNPPVAVNPAEKPPVRTVAIWSRRDGIVAPASARGAPPEADERIEVTCKHNELVSDKAAVAVILELLRD